MRGTTRVAGLEHMYKMHHVSSKHRSVRIPLGYLGWPEGFSPGHTGS